MRGRDPAALVASIFHASLASIDLAARVERVLRGLEPRLPRRVRLLAVGKCAPRMAAGALRVLEPVEPALVVTSRGVPASVPVMRAGHPLPDGASLEAGRRALALARRSAEGTALVVLVSGGASAMLCAPIAGVSLAIKRRVTDALLRDGVPIAEINDVRALLSDVKGGKLARAVAGARVVTLVASDILGRGDLTRVGSGPTLGRFAPSREAHRVAGPGDLLGAALAAAKRTGLPVRRLPFADGPVEELAERYAAIESPGLHVAVGEPTVRVGRAGGRGGRSGHLALLVARKIHGRRVCFLAAGSDGIDGSSSAAGATVDGGTWRRAEAGGLSPARALREFDSARVHRSLRTDIFTGATGLNLLDLHLTLVDRGDETGV
ncbi:MAG: DUF4147 domain-containing protein [Deltaproteobacteria bacterium]|nr:DUF4147 domain-containing protein [Deltaproteobacteria bacterium]